MYSSQPRSQVKLWLALSVIIATPIITYRNSLEGEFHFDDYPQIVENPTIKTLWGVFAHTPEILGTRFVSDFTFYLNYKLDGYNVFYYHLFNLGFHTINCILIYFVVLLLLRKAGVNKSYLAFLASIFFALHPINSEPLNYIVHGRYMTLCTMFYLLGLMLFILAFDPGRRKWLYFAGCGICYILSIFSKEVGITLPGVLFFYYILFVAKDGKDIQRASSFFAGGIILAITAILMWIEVIKKSTLMESNLPFFYNISEILTELNVAVVYIGLYLLPLPSRLNVDHPVPLAPSIDFRVAISILIIVGLISLTIWAVMRSRMIAFPLLWLFITHSPTTFVHKGEPISEYRNYLPFFGFALLVVLCLNKIFSYSKFQRIYTIVATLIISALFAFADIERNNVWRRDLTLWNDAALKTPENFRAYVNRGLSKEKIGDCNGALADFDKSLELNISNDRGYFNRGNVKKKIGDHRGAIRDYDKTVELNPSYVKAYLNRGVAKGSLGDYRGAISDYDKALELNPGLIEAYSNRGAGKYALGDYKDAIEDYDKALELNSGYVGAYNNRGLAKSAIGDYKGAISDYNRALELNPNHSGAYVNRGLAKNSLGDGKGAVEDWGRAIELDNSLKEKLKPYINQARGTK